MDDDNVDGHRTGNPRVLCTYIYIYMLFGKTANICSFIFVETFFVHLASC